MRVTNCLDLARMGPPQGSINVRPTSPMPLVSALSSQQASAQALGEHMALKNKEVTRVAGYTDA